MWFCPNKPKKKDPAKALTEWARDRIWFSNAPYSREELDSYIKDLSVEYKFIEREGRKGVQLCAVIFHSRRRAEIKGLTEAEARQAMKRLHQLADGPTAMKYESLKQLITQAVLDVFPRKKFKIKERSFEPDRDELIRYASKMSRLISTDSTA